MEPRHVLLLSAAAHRRGPRRGGRSLHRAGAEQRHARAGLRHRQPLALLRLAGPVSSLSGDGLVLRRASSLAETIADQPGLSATWFGPNANRPVIRGLDGDRVRMLGNGGNSFDASALSYDHAVPIDPLVVERIEVLRGPAALLYGGSAIGGVVNAIDNRIPREPIRSLGGAAELRLGGAQRERGGAALVETGDGRWALHADAFSRETDDLRVPRFVPREDGVPLDETRTVRNSASRSKGGALGASLTFDSGHVGVAVDRFDSRYGIVAEPDVTIRMQRDHLALDGEWRWADGPLRGLRATLGRTVYEHEEIEGSGAVGTVFATRGNEARLEAQHAPLGPLRGAVGVQIEDSDFSALGEEAFVPSTTTRKQGLFLLEETNWPLGTLSAGARVERVRVASAGDADPAEPRFGAAKQRRFTLGSASLSNLWPLAPGWSRPPRSRTPNARRPRSSSLPTARTPRPRPTSGATRRWAWSVGAISISRCAGRAARASGASAPSSRASRASSRWQRPARRSTWSAKTAASRACRSTRSAVPARGCVAWRCRDGTESRWLAGRSTCRRSSIACAATTSTAASRC
ncbi:hypothetical protein FSC37_04865 [Piscinibacter aquaticus]|uniref:TonB-dependent receptor plug domain-containing protein n=1 Tax=Piscinibacter aquaticus TaxID=392597 RepID=A0A5C6TYB6_9BURK|nr:hypothetical protein FSC37_04865 [Piscinibacter aquaticus]